MKMKKFFLALVIIGISGFVYGQRTVKFGFRAGAALTTIFGPSEKDDSGNSLESYNLAARICVGGTVSLPFNDRFGIGAEVLFSQKGAMHRYESDNSYLKLKGSVADPGSEQTFFGHKKILSKNITNGYIEVPLTFYAFAIKERLMFEFGPSVSFLISSESLGILKYGIIDPNNPNAADFLEMEIDYKAYQDQAGAFAAGAVDKSGKLDQTSIVYPSKIGSYYFFDEKRGNLTNMIDFGLNFGASFFFTKGLRIGTRVYYGLTDVTNNIYDINQKNLDTNNQFILREDNDTNFGIQLFIGLQF
jgi:hypothetical protein